MNFKLLFFSSIMAFCALAMVGCGEKSPKEIYGDLVVSQVSNTECGATGKGIEDPDEDKLSYNEGVLSVAHKNLKVNCCFDSIKVIVSLSNDTLHIREYEWPLAMCNCICSVDNSFVISNVPSGKYTVVFDNWAGGAHAERHTFH